MWTRQKFILSVLGGVLGIALVVYLVASLFDKDKDAENREENAAGAQQPLQNNGSAVQKEEKPKAKIITLEEQDQILAKQTASNFIMRFGTYSNHGGGINIDSAEPFMTSDGFKALKEKYGTDAEVKFPYAGIITRVISIDLKEWLPEKRAKLLAHTLREEDNGTSIKTSYKDAEILLVKSDIKWLVDKAEWVE